MIITGDNMKKFALILALLAFAAPGMCNDSAIMTPITATLNTSTYTAITMPGGCRPISLYTEDGTGFYIAVDSTGTGEVLVPASTSVSYGKACPDDTLVAVYAKAVSGTPVLVLLPSK